MFANSCAEWATTARARAKALARLRHDRRVSAMVSLRELAVQVETLTCQLFDLLEQHKGGRKPRRRTNWSKPRWLTAKRATLRSEGILSIDGVRRYVDEFRGRAISMMDHGLLRDTEPARLPINRLEKLLMSMAIGVLPQHDPPPPAVKRARATVRHVMTEVRRIRKEATGR